MSDYRYLFPFEKIRPGASVIIYGAGTLGQEYLKQLLITGYCKVVAMADRNYEKYPDMAVPVISPDAIRDFGYDYIVIAIRVQIAANEIFRILHEQGVPDEKIICVFERDVESINVFAGTTSDTDDSTKQDHSSSMAILISGGLGDNIIQKRFVTEVIRFAPDISVDIFSIRNADYLRYLYSDVSNVKNVYEDLGSRYDSSCHDYGIAMAIEACRYVRIDEIKEDVLSEKYAGLLPRLKKVRAEAELEKISISTPVAVPNNIRRYRGLNAYNGFNYNDAFEINDKVVNIPITERGEAFAASLNLTDYYTVNFGTGECADPSKVAKMWRQERFEKVVSMVKESYPDMVAVQLGARDAIRLSGVDEFVLGEPMENVASVLKGAAFHLDIEGGTVHMASQIGTKCFVLFGPSVEEYYGYEGNENIKAGKCHGCYGLLPDVNRCARDMAEPECMALITPEMVFEKIDLFLRNDRR
ncbi:MAG: hypothetical protein K6B14_09840 [Lachnospiraceae bacterium]|nr:hypothetical protein [Lachnospiraceae bacterium]